MQVIEVPIYIFSRLETADDDGDTVTQEDLHEPSVEPNVGMVHSSFVPDFLERIISLQ